MHYHIVMHPHKVMHCDILMRVTVICMRTLQHMRTLQQWLQHMMQPLHRIATHYNTSGSSAACNTLQHDLHVSHHSVTL